MPHSPSYEVLSFSQLDHHEEMDNLTHWLQILELLHWLALSLS